MASAVQPTADRQMVVGRVFERAFGAVRTNPLVILGLALVIGALPNLLMTYLFVSGGVSSPQALAAGTISPRAFVAAALVSAIASMAIGALVQGALTRATISAAEGNRVSFGDSLSTSLRVLVPLIILAIVSAIGIGFGLILLVVPGIILMLMWSVAVPVLVAERTGIFESLRRSGALTKGAKGRILGIFIVVLIAYGIVTMILGVIGIASYSATNAAGGLTATNLIGSVVAGTLLNAAWGTIQPSLYVELRQWKEGTSVEALEQVFA
ncbi:MAG: YciC family protein [Sphingomicrobium sp.]